MTYLFIQQHGIISNTILFQMRGCVYPIILKGPLALINNSGYFASV